MRKVIVASAILVTFQAFAQSDAGINSAAKSISTEIMTTFKVGAPIAACGNRPVQLFMADATGATELLLKATRAGSSPILIELAEPTLIGNLPAPIAEALNRIQRAGGTVTMVDTTKTEGIPAIIAWAGSQAGELIAAAVRQLISAAADTWASTGLSRYEAEVRYRRSPSGSRMAYEVAFLCK